MADGHKLWPLAYSRRGSDGITILVNIDGRNLLAWHLHPPPPHRAAGSRPATSRSNSTTRQVVAQCWIPQSNHLNRHYQITLYRL